MTLQNELLNKILMKQYGDEIKELKEYLLEDIKVKVKETEARIIESATLSMKRVEANAGYLKKLNELTRKIEADILNVAVDIIEDYELVDFSIAHKFKTFDDYLQYKRYLNKKNVSHETDEVNNQDEIDNALNKAEQVISIALNFGHVIKSTQEIVNNEKVASQYVKALKRINDEFEKLK